MSGQFISRGFSGKRRLTEEGQRVPPGQYLTQDFPVLSAGPTQRVPLDQWTFSIDGQVRRGASWSWEEFNQLPQEKFNVDIHCVTKWSKLDTQWEGVSVDTLLSHADLDPAAQFVTVYSYGGYTTNLPLADLTGAKAFVGHTFAGKPLVPEHGGPARLVVPHLYFWKSAKWVHGLRFTGRDIRGFWESLGYHDRGDPWKEERYQGD